MQNTFALIQACKEESIRACSVIAAVTVVVFCYSEYGQQKNGNKLRTHRHLYGRIPYAVRFCGATENDFRSIVGSRYLLGLRLPFHRWCLFSQRRVCGCGVVVAQLKIRSSIYNLGSEFPTQPPYLLQLYLKYIWRDTQCLSWVVSLVRSMCSSTRTDNRKA